MIQLRKAGLVADAEDVKRLRSIFERTHFVRLQSLLDPQLLSLALSYIEQGNWRENVVIGSVSYSEYILEIGAAVNLLLFVSNSPRFLETIIEITGCKSLTLFEGRVYRMEPNIVHDKKWHSDNVDNQLIGMSVNLSPLGYQGGLFQMREQSSHRMLVEIANTGPGDAILFRLSGDFQHRVTEVQTGGPKTAFAGWFSTKESLKERLSHKKIDSTAKCL